MKTHLRLQSLELTRERRHTSRDCAVKDLRPHCSAPKLQSLSICCASSPLSLLQLLHALLERLQFRPQCGSGCICSFLGCTRLLAGRLYNV